MQHENEKSIVTKEPILIKFGCHTRINQSNMLQSNVFQKETLQKEQSYQNIMQIRKKN